MCLYFSKFILSWKFILFAVLLHKCHIYEKSDSCDIAWFWACWYKFMKIKSWLKNTWVDMVKNGCDHPGYGALKLAVSREWIDWIKSCFVWRYNSGKLCYFNDFWVGVVKNECSKLCCIWKMNLWIELIFWMLSDAITFGYTDSPTLHLWL